nr:hypothetical protein CFP56_02240 [Quercus suber]
MAVAVTIERMEGRNQARAYINFEISKGEVERIKELDERLIDILKHLKVACNRPCLALSQQPKLVHGLQPAMVWRTVDPQSNVL